MNEKDIPPPINPLTIQINLAVIRYMVSNFFKKYLHGYKPIVTSELRTAEHNKEVGGIPNSTHVHGLAMDFVLSTETGHVLSEAEATPIYTSLIAPNWPGFTELEKASAGEGYHIHVQLSREISQYSGFISMAGLGVIGYSIVSAWGKVKA